MRRLKDSMSNTSSKPITTPQPRCCKVADRRDRAEIDAALGRMGLDGGETFRGLAARMRVSCTLLFRHRTRCLGLPLLGAPAAPVQVGDPLPRELQGALGLHLPSTADLVRVLLGAIEREEPAVRDRVLGAVRGAFFTKEARA